MACFPVKVQLWLLKRGVSLMEENVDCVLPLAQTLLIMKRIQLKHTS